MRTRHGRQPAQHRAEWEVRVVDAKGLDRLHHRCGTCEEIFQSIEELREHAQVHARPADGRSEAVSANRYHDDTAYSTRTESRIRIG